MALIPGSYARAAGLQSEINKVTITRVAGSEVQFRRTIDTYQKDLRYHVNQIGREQKQLKRSMRRYSRKLHNSRKEQKQRQAKVKEDAERLKQHSESFKQAEAAVRKATYVNPKPQAEGDVKGENPVDEPGSTDQKKSSAEVEDGESVFPATADGGVEGELEEKPDPDGTGAEHASRDSEKSHKVFLTKNSLPYLRAKQNPIEKSQEKDKSHRSDETLNIGTTTTLLKSLDAESALPIIDEETEGGSDPSVNKNRQGEIKLSETNRQPQENSIPGNSGAQGKTSKTSSSSLTIPAVTITSLNTKVVSKGDESGGFSAGGGKSELSDTGTSLPALYGGSERRGAAKTGVSFGDLIKLQHMPSSSTKKLFKLVDRLAAKHGIKDMPEASSFPAPSLDPRSNEKMKQQRSNEESQMSEGMVRQAAVLYSMKYGYQVDDDQFLRDTLPPILLSEDTSNNFLSPYDTARADSAVAKLHATSRRSSNTYDIHRSLDTDISDTTSRRLSLLSVRRESLDMTSPSSALSDMRWPPSLAVDKPAAETGASLDAHSSRSGHHKNGGQELTISELSRQVSQLRERTVLETGSKHTPNSLDPSDRTHGRTTSPGRQTRSERRMSVVSRHSRPRSRSRRETVNSQLQKRLKASPHGDGSQGNTAWQSAFGRLKLVHTLRDLSQHFQRDGS